MRIWHKDLIDMLPREQLIAQWRELSAIASNIKLKGSPNHILVNRVMEYPMSHLVSYAYYLRQEITKRGYRTMDSVWNKIAELDKDDAKQIISFEQIFSGWHNDEYLRICYYNLYEKFLCSGISENDWQKIKQKVEEKI